jgi:hypothetical protein
MDGARSGLDVITVSEIYNYPAWPSCMASELVVIHPENREGAKWF